MKNFGVAIFLGAMMQAPLAHGATANPVNPTGETLVLGIVSINVEKKSAEHQEFINYLALSLFSRANLKGTATVVPTALQLAQLLIDAKVDFFMESAYPTHVIGWRSGSRPILRR